MCASRCILAVVVALLSACRLGLAFSTSDLRNKTDSWITSPEGIALIDNVISWQRPEGGWEKGYDASTAHQPDQPYYRSTTQPTTVPFPVQEGMEWHGESTIDNNITTTETRLMARAYRLTNRPNTLESFNRGIDLLLTMQYPSGGWPQRWPLSDNYGRDITLNDTAMVNVMHLLKDVAQNTEGHFAFVDDARRAKCKAAFDRGVDCLVKLQINRDGKPTGWAQQYDPDTFQPAKARAYELPSLAGDESATAVLLLMEVPNPSPDVQHAIHAAAEWFEASQVKGIRVERTADDAIIVEDPDAPPLWSRFYELETNRPFFCGRDGVKKYSLAEVERERRHGYAWLRPWGAPVLKQYKEWSAKFPKPDTH